MPSISSLPLELLYYILSLAPPTPFDLARRTFLGRIALVSRSWYAVAGSLMGEEEVLVVEEGVEAWGEMVRELCARREKRGESGVMRRLRIEEREALPPALGLGWVEEAAPVDDLQAEELFAGLKKLQILTSISLFTPFATFQSLIRLTLSVDKVDEASLGPLLAAAPNLSHFSLVWPEWNEHQPSPSPVCSSLLTLAPQLVHLSLTSPPPAHHPFLLALLPRCTSLTSIHLSLHYRTSLLPILQLLPTPPTASTKPLQLETTFLSSPGPSYCSILEAFEALVFESRRLGAWSVGWAGARGSGSPRERREWGEECRRRGIEPREVVLVS
ncbi:hypothetical protein BCR35DRAFT_301636 [Leucosporidium creatinivorum]|uniref:Rhodanese domain-containing protein n=1 Tax=Leucosporidium creatinivorum TaxID=106004 RepID=A0A1Y2FYS0_9BASI|nr:hypothetical protein BCR35DRAFT_301636 [Leucosporidium creatinivorum]